MTILDNLLSAFEKNKKDPFLQYGIAIEYRNAGDMDNALGFFESVYKNFPDYVPNYYHLAQALESLGKTEEAKNICLQGIRVARDAGNLHAVSELERSLSVLE